MKPLHIKITLILGTLFFLAACAKQGEITYADELQRLDRLVSSNDEYFRTRIDKIAEVKLKIPGSTIRDQISLCDSLFFLYKGFQSDSALHYVRRQLDLCRALRDTEREADALLNLVSVYTVTGSYMESIELISMLSGRRLTPSQRSRMYYSSHDVYESLVRISNDEVLGDLYNRKAASYRDSILAAEPLSPYILHKVMLEKGNYQGAIDLINPMCASKDVRDPRVGPAAYVMSEIYRRLGWKEAEKEWLIISATSDLMGATKEYTSLICLSSILYEEGDIQRAFNYLNRAISDATYCDARLRIEEVSYLVAMINNAYTQKNKRNFMILYTIVGIFSLMAMLLLGMILLSRKQRKRLSSINRELSAARTRQEEAKRQIVEASNIKNSYITQLMLECIARIERLDQYRRGLNRKALSREYDDILRELKSNAVIEDEWKSFYNVFDTTFLSVFPTFVSDFDELLKPENRFRIPQQKVLNPELRIYALIRLGIDSTEKIASLLRYSRSTIYAYRSRTRLKAISPDTFEEDVCKIASI